MDDVNLLAEVRAGQPVEIMKVGLFRDRLGREVRITSGLFDALVANFNAGEAGQEIPFDIDHEFAQAAGWLRQLWHDGVKLFGQPEWNRVGEELIGNRVYRYLSATVDMAKQVLKAVSLVNFPAIKGLSPVTLSEAGGDVYTIITALEGAMEEEKVMSEELGVKSEAELREEIRAEMAAELADRQAFEAELRERVRAEERAKVEATFARHAEVVAFAEEVCTGGLMADRDAVIAFLEALDGELFTQAQALLRAKVVPLGEIGSSGKGHESRLVMLDAKTLHHLERWIEDGGNVDEFFALNAEELGEPGQYDLSVLKEADGEE